MVNNNIDNLKNPGFSLSCERTNAKFEAKLEEINISQELRQTEILFIGKTEQ